MEFGRRIQSAINELNLSQSQLAEQIGVSQSYVSNLISGRKAAPSQAVVCSLAMALNIPVADLCALAGLEESVSKTPFILGVAGASGSGKSWFAAKLQQLHPHGVTIISQDRYYKPAAEVALLPFTWDEPAALYLDDLLADLNKLKAGESVLIPTYDFARHERSAMEVIHPAPMVVVEGHLVFHCLPLLQAMDETVWVQADDYQLLRRRLMRDCSERGRNWQEVLEVFEAVVMPANQLYVQPCRAAATLELNNNQHNPDEVPLLAKSLVAYVQSL